MMERKGEGWERFLGFYFKLKDFNFYFMLPTHTQLIHAIATTAADVDDAFLPQPLGLSLMYNYILSWIII